jgi:hypothetical protein
MSVLWIVVFLLLLCSITWILLGSDKSEEGFQAEPTTWDALKNFFHYQVGPVEKPTGIPIVMSPGVAQLLPHVDSAIETPGFPTKSLSLFSRLMDVRDPSATEDEKCRALPHPRLLQASRGSRTRAQISAGEGCGWWYVPDPTTPSVGAYGNGPTEVSGKAAAPVDAALLPTGGRWIWDIDEANRLEEIKRCKTISTCKLLSASDGCGFCPSKGYSVPVTDQGAVKYTQDDEGNCGDAANIVLRAADCPNIVIPPQDYAGDFDYDLNGNPIRNEKYNQLMNPQGIPIRDPCELENGRLTKLCRLTLCKELGRCKEGKGLHRIIGADGKLTDTDRVALFYLKKDRGIDLPDALWLPIDASGARLLSKADASDMMERLYTAASSGPPTRGRAAALWFLNETPFNLCDYQDSDQDTFPLQCIQREFRKAGCQASGSRYPQSVGAFNDMTYGQIRTQFRDLYAQMQDTKVVKNVREQDEAVQRCLGIEIDRAMDETYETNPNLCREQGLEYWFTTIPTRGQRLLYARYVLQDESQLVTDKSARGAELKNALNAKGSVRGYTARTYADLAGTNVTLTLTVPREVVNFYGLWVNQRQILAQSGTIGTTYTVALPTYQRSEIEVRYEGTGTDLSLGAPVLTTSPRTPLYLAQSWWKPFVSLRATKQGFLDENRFLQLESATSIKVQQQGTRWGTPITGLSLKSTNGRGMWYSMVQTITMMLYWSAMSESAVLWKLDQGDGGLRDTVAKLSIIGNRLVFTVQSGTSIFEIRSTTTIGTANRWMHVVIVLGAPLSKTMIYLDGKDVTSRTPVSTGTLNPQTTAFQRVVLGGVGVEGLVGWFHVYERALGSAEVGRDLAYDDPLYSDKEYTQRVRQVR